MTQRFPDGPAVHIFNSWGHAVAVLRDRMPIGGGHMSADGKLIVVTVKTDPAVLLGVWASEFVDHASLEWPNPLKHMVIDRSSFCGAPVRDASDRFKGPHAYTDDRGMRPQTITFKPPIPGEAIESLMGGGIYLGEVGDVPCDTDAQEDVSGVKTPDRDR